MQCTLPHPSWRKANWCPEMRKERSTGINAPQKEGMVKRNTISQSCFWKAMELEKMSVNISAG